MKRFRRFIIALAQVLQIFWIIVVTLGGGWLGWQLQQTMDYGLYGLQIWGWPAAEIVIPILGGVIGLFLSATGAAVVFLLAEIAANTRAAVFMLRRDRR
ncbi:MAG TPA: hypothetical protein VL048_21175 [Xanthobacteraceae bacterium]|nr:hypothetical protein [Xanthobacteraceae bacterium]